MMATLVTSLGWSISSCSDDDDKNDDGRTAEDIAQDPFEKESKAGHALFRLVSQLAVGDSLPDNWKTATFEPSIGQVLDESQPFVRTITVNNAKEAVNRYNSLTGKNLPATTTNDTYQVDGVGSLTLNVGSSNTIATIDVNVKQLPKLTQLRLVSVSSVGENGSFSGEPYYRFGDVVEDKEECNWICVRPCYSPDKKSDSHWMTFQIPTKYTKDVQKKKSCMVSYPINLGVNKEKMQYLAQLMAILANPEGYKAFAGLSGKKFGGTGLGGLAEGAMGTDKLVALAKMWDKYDVWTSVASTGYMFEYVDQFKEDFKHDICFIFDSGEIESKSNGYNLLIPVAAYSGVENFYSEEDPEYKTYLVDMMTVPFNIFNFYISKGLAGDDSFEVPDAYVVRYKTGKQLSSNWLFNPDPTEALPGVKEVFRFNNHKTEWDFFKD